MPGLLEWSVPGSFSWPMNRINTVGYFQEMDGMAGGPERGVKGLREKDLYATSE